jgi:hypothetical protein
MGYVGQFDSLVRAQDRGRAVRNTRTIVVFDDGLVVCAVPVAGRPEPQLGPISRLLFGARPAGQKLASDHGDEQIRESAVAMASGATADAFAQRWADATAIPFDVIDQVVLRRPRQVSELSICAATAGPGRLDRSVYLGDLSAEQVRDVLGPLLGDRLQIEVAD